MWKNPPHLDKYLYTKTNFHSVRTLGLLGIIATAFMAYGFFLYVKMTPINLILFGPIIIIFITNKFLRYLLQLFYQRFNVHAHEKFIAEFWKNNTEPAVDVFLPYAGESISIHEQVVKGVSNLNYKNLNVYMLDDAGSDEHKKIADKYGFNYLSRPNKGEYKKSGNLQYGYEHSSGEFVLILDADFIPTPECLKELIPYLVNDTDIGILQTPQYFEQSNDVHNRSLIEFGGGNIVEDFYRIIMPCRDEFKAAMCVGTSAIYRRTAIKVLDNTPKVAASEDLATGLSITRAGFYVKYLPLIVSIGKSPEDFQGYFKQHMRWCSGTLVFAKFWPTAKLSVMQRLIYLINPLYYLSEAFAIFFPFQFLYLLYFFTDSLSLSHILYFLPYIFLDRIVIPFAKVNKDKLGTRIAAFSNSYTYFYTYIRMLTNSVPAWHPAGVKIKGLHEDFLNAVNTGTAISCSFIMLFLFVIISKPEIFSNYNTYAVLGWGFYTTFWHVLFLASVSAYVHRFKIDEVRNTVDKLFLYIKTHAAFALFLLLTLTIFSQVSFNLLNPNSQVVVKIAGLFITNNDDRDIKIAQIDSIPNVLAASVASNENVEFKYIVSEGDTIITLAEKAVKQYSNKNGIHLSDEEVIDATTNVAKSISGRNNLDKGAELSFSTEIIASFVQSAKLAKY